MSITFVRKCKNFYKTRIKREEKEIKEKLSNKLTAFIDIKKISLF